MLLLLGNVNRFFATEAAFALCSAARSQRSSTMVDDKIKDPPGLSKKAKGAAAPAPDERDAAVERLERAVAEERQHAAMLRKTVEELRFKAGILEKSYAKQLEDARLRSEAAERELADQQARIAALETAHEDTMRLLAEARRELERTPGGRGQSRKAPASTDGVRINATAHDDAESQGEECSLTINKLMKGSRWAEKERQPAGHEEDEPKEQVRTDQESTPEELIAPDLVFTVEGDDA